MGLSWNAVGGVGLAAGLLGSALAATVLFVSPGRSQNRRLALVLALESATAILGGGIALLTDVAADAYAAQSTADLAFGVMVLAYVLFLATLAAPLTRPLRGRAAMIALVGASLAFATFYLLRSDLFLAGVAPLPFAAFGPVAGPLLLPALIAPSILVFLFGVAASISMWRSAAPGSALRRQAAAYAVAFALRDAAWIAFLIDLFVLRSGLPSPALFNASLVLFYGILAYGILRHQLFDIDLKIKWTLRRGTLVGAFVAAFFIVGSIAEQFLQSYGIVVGGVAVGLLLFALRPLERAADRLADRAMPKVRDTAEYRTVRKREVYRAAIESALRDGSISERERDILATLADQLGLSAGDAREIEREASQPDGLPSRTARPGGAARPR